jgi:hypothetical protein
METMLHLSFSISEENYIKQGKPSGNHTRKTHHCIFGLVVISLLVERK